jgi:hypothetical protein
MKRILLVLTFCLVFVLGQVFRSAPCYNPSVVKEHSSCFQESSNIFRRVSCNETIVNFNTCFDSTCRNCTSDIVQSFQTNLCYENSFQYTCELSAALNVTASLTLFGERCLTPLGVKLHYFGKCLHSTVTTCNRDFQHQLGQLKISNYTDDLCQQVDQTRTYKRGECARLSTGEFFRLSDCQGTALNQFASLGISGGILAVGILAFLGISAVLFICV